MVDNDVQLYCPTLLEDCLKIVDFVKSERNLGSFKFLQASTMNHIIKPWPFWGQGMDMIGQIYLSTNKGHKWILATTSYFTMWVEAILMNNVTTKDVIRFVKEHIIYRFGIEQTITTDQGSVFILEQFRNFVEETGVTLIQPSPYYSQANGQTKASNEIIIKSINRKLDEYPKQWHDKLAKTLWPYRMSCNVATMNMPYQLVYDQEAVKPWEININSRRITFQNELSVNDDEY